MPPPGYLSPAGIESCLVYLANTYPAICQLLVLPEQSHQGRTIRAVRIGRGRGRRHAVLFIGGVHAREIVNPDLLVTFAFNLCQAYTSGTGLTFGPKTYSASTVRIIVDGMAVFILPLVNPDGREFVMAPTGNPMWRKNRNPNPGQPCMGVDLNRNCDFLWASGIGTSASSCSDVFKGSAAFSEPETRNVRHLLDEFPNIGCMLDVHSYSELILYPWGDDTDQTTNPAMNFMDPAYNGLRGDPTNPVYQEYIPAADLSWFISVGTRLRDAIAAVRGRLYTLQQSVLLYPTSGTTKDYAYSRHFVAARKRRVYAYTLETGREFQPPFSEALNIISEVSAGLVQFCLSCVCVVRETVRGTAIERRLDVLEDFRDRAMLVSPAGRRYAVLLDEHGGEIAELMAPDADLRRRTLEVLRRLTSVVASWEKPRPRKLDRRLVGDLDDLLQAYGTKGTRELAQAIEEIRAELGEFEGKTPVEGLEAASRHERARQRRK
jgi:carboxypeptidase T